MGLTVLPNDVRAYYRAKRPTDGFDPIEWEKGVEYQARSSYLLDKLLCPDCGNRLSRSRDSYQGNAGKRPGTLWFLYDCPCGFHVCRDEKPEGPTLIERIRYWYRERFERGNRVI